MERHLKYDKIEFNHFLRLYNNGEDVEQRQLVTSEYYDEIVCVDPSVETVKIIQDMIQNSNAKFGQELIKLVLIIMLNY